MKLLDLFLCFTCVSANAALAPLYVTPQQYGAKGGTVDDTIAFSNALNSGFTVFVPGWTNYTVQSLYLSNRTAMFGAGSKITMKTGATGYLIDTSTATNFALWNLYFDGNNPPDTNVQYWQNSQGNRSGLHTYVFSGGSVTGCKFQNFTDAGVRIGAVVVNGDKQIGNVGVPQTYRQSKLFFYGNEAKGNYLGYELSNFDANNLQEYVNFTTCFAFNNNINLRTSSGNTHITGGNYSGGNYGIEVLGGALNDGHGICVGAEMNHNNYTIHVNTTSGFTFLDCKMLGGGGGSGHIWVEGTTGLKVQGCDIQMDYGINDGGGTNYCVNNSFYSHDPATVWTNVNGGVMDFADLTPLDSSGHSAVNQRLQGSNYFRGDVNIAGATTLSALTASLPVYTGSSKQLVSGTAPVTSYAAGTAYTLTGTPAQLTFGTTSPGITLATAGTYMITGMAGVKYASATYAGAQTITLKLRRTNNTAADLTSGSRAVELPVLTTFTGGDVMSTPTVIYAATAGDIVQLFGSVSATPSAGSVQTDSAEIIAVRLY